MRMKIPAKFDSSGTGTAVAVKCSQSLHKIGFGKILKSGMVEFLFPTGASEDFRDQLIIEEILRLTKLKKRQIEIIRGKNDKLILTLNGFDPEELNQILTETSQH